MKWSVPENPHRSWFGILRSSNFSGSKNPEVEHGPKAVGAKNLQTLKTSSSGSFFVLVHILGLEVKDWVNGDLMS